MSNQIDFSRFKKLAGFLRNLMHVFFWIAVSLGGLLAVGAMVIGFTSAAKFTGINGYGSLSFSTNGLLSIRVNPDDLAGINIKPIIVSILAMTSVALATTAPFLRQLAALLHSVVEDKPFAPENSRRLAIMGWVLIIGGLICQLVKTVCAQIIIHTLNSAQYGSSGELNLGLLLVGVLLLILSGIFRYGAFLQQSFDETV